MKPFIRLLALVLLLGSSQSAHADAKPGDPFAYDLRFAFSPLAFQAAVSQAWFGSAVRVEYGPWRFMDVALDARFAWLNATRDAALGHSYAVRANLAFHISQSLDDQPLYGTVYPAEPAAITGSNVGSDRDLPVPSSQRMQTPLTIPGDRDLSLVAAMRRLHSLRVGASYNNLLERARPVAEEVAANRMTVAHVGYSFATHWNLTTKVTGKPEVGYRRFYGDVLLTTGAWVDAPERHSRNGRIALQPFGARVGMQGAMQGLARAAPSVGFAYDLELGAYPGRGGLEGYLFLALGVAVDAATR